MATVYWNTNAGSNNGDIGDAGNYWSDVGATIPYGAVPSTGDNVIVQATSTAISIGTATGIWDGSSGGYTYSGGTFSQALNVGNSNVSGITVAGVFTANGAAITSGTFSTDAYLSNLSWSISSFISGTTYANNVNFTGAPTTTTLVGVNGCIYNANTAWNTAITDTGGTFIAGSFYQPVVATGSTLTGGLFTGNNICVLTSCAIGASWGIQSSQNTTKFINCTIASGSWYTADFSGSVYITGGVFYGPNTFAQNAPVTSINISGATFSGSVALVIAFPSAGLVLNGNPTATVSGVVTAAGTATYPTSAQVLLGVSYGQNGGSNTGTVTLPVVGNVRAGITYGPSLSNTGTLSTSGGGQVGYLG